jgi:hypothetical protein
MRAAVEAQLGPEGFVHVGYGAGEHHAPAAEIDFHHREVILRGKFLHNGGVLRASPIKSRKLRAAKRLLDVGRGLRLRSQDHGNLQPLRGIGYPYRFRVG